MLEKKSLRLFYTINSSPQYILARSCTRVPVILLQDSGLSYPSKKPPLYASVLLKTCLETICQSSPELKHENSREFSIYVLDPLESNSAPAPVHISGANFDSQASGSKPLTEQPRGVAVGLGLMSSALTADDSNAMTVVGTLVKQATGQEALEVIFALRETTLMKFPTSSLSPLPPLPFQYVHSQNKAQKSTVAPDQALAQTHLLTTDVTKETLASIQKRSKAKFKPPKPVRQSTIPVTESDKLMNADTYIGPVKKKGRPKMISGDSKSISSQTNVASGSRTSGSTSQSKEVIVINDSDSDGAPTVVIQANPVSLDSLNKPQDQSSKRSPFTTDPLTKRISGNVDMNYTQVKVEPQEPTLLDVLALFSAASSSSLGKQNAAVLTALNAIDSSSSKTRTSEENALNPALVSALQHLLAGYAKPNSINTESNPSESSNHLRASSGSQTHDGIIILDKENVNPVVSIKSHGKDPDRFSTNVSPPSFTNTLALNSQTDQNFPRLGLSAHSNAANKTGLSMKDSTPSSGKEPVRKRTLSDFMDEKEQGRSKGKGRERDCVEKREGHRHSVSQRRTLKTSAKDSLRHYPRILASNQPRAEQPSNYYRTPLESLSSPARSRSDLDHQKQVQLESSIIETTSSNQQPSPLPSPKHNVSASSPVRKVQGSRKKYIVPEWARTSTSTQPRLSEDTQRALEEAEERKKKERNAARKRLTSINANAKCTSACSVPDTRPTGNTQNNQQPNLHGEKVDASYNPNTRDNSLPTVASSDILFPCSWSSRPSTPPPNINIMRNVPETPKRNRLENDPLFTPTVASGSLFGSVQSPSHQTILPPAILTSPLGNRKKARTRSELNSWSSSTGLPSNIKYSSEDAVAGELDDPMNDLECPPSSLPIASSDIDVDVSGATELSRDSDGENIEIESLPVKQHWAGLPPSSPPAPSSPILVPESDFLTEKEMNELPITLLDNETDHEFAQCDTDTPMDSNGIHSNSISFADAGSVSSNSATPQFTTFADQSNVFPSMDDIISEMNPDLTAIFQNGLDGIDLTEFWETFNPLLDENTHPSEVQEPTEDFSEYFNFDDREALPPMAEIDHARLADQMEALLSGCLM